MSMPNESLSSWYEYQYTYIPQITLLIYLKTENGN